MNEYQARDEINRLRRRVLVLYEALEDMTMQFARCDQHEGKAMMRTAGMRSLEEAFAILGWDDPITVDQAMRKMQEPVEGIARVEGQPREV